MLLDRATGLPAFYPNLYILTELRQTNMATATIERALREIMVLLDYLALCNIDLADRIRKGQLLSLGEIDGLARHCRQRFEQLQTQEQETAAGGVATTHLIQRRAHRHLIPFTEVSLPTAANRIRTIHAYLSWLVIVRLSHQGLSEAVKMSLAQVRTDVLPILLARMPISKGRNAIGQRQGALPETMERFVQIIDPASLENPWRGEFTKKRNVLLLYWLWKLGLRRGELLNIKIRDIDFRANTVIVARRADDPEDPRKYQPRVKTRDRKLPLAPDLAAATNHYIVYERSRIPGAKNPFLFVAEATGAPLSLSAINKLFRELRMKCPDLPDDFTAHVLRHTWNDDFSEHTDHKGLSDEITEKMRTYMMGWSPTSKTASVYTRRRIEEKARQASLEMQSRMILPKNNAQ